MLPVTNSSTNLPSHFHFTPTFHHFQDHPTALFFMPCRRRRVQPNRVNFCNLNIVSYPRFGGFLCEQKRFSRPLMIPERSFLSGSSSPVNNNRNPFLLVLFCLFLGVYVTPRVSIHLFIAPHSHGLVTSLCYQEGRLSNMQMTHKMFHKLCDRTVGSMIGTLWCLRRMKAGLRWSKPSTVERGRVELKARKIENFVCFCFFKLKNIPSKYYQFLYF